MAQGGWNRYKLEAVSGAICARERGDHYGRNSKRDASPTPHICPVTRHHRQEKVYGRYDIERVSFNPANISDHMWFQAEYITLGKVTDNKITGGDAWVPASFWPM